MTLWRISNHSDLEGLGGERSSGRWHTAARGRRIVYLAEHPALALLETLVNLKGNAALFPDRYQLMKVAVGQGVSQEEWSAGVGDTQSIGDSWLGSGRAALMRVPAAPVPESWNYLLNPRHADAKNVVVEWAKWIGYDKRLFHV